MIAWGVLFFQGCQKNVKTTYVAIFRAAEKIKTCCSNSTNSKTKKSKKNKNNKTTATSSTTTTKKKKKKKEEEAEEETQEQEEKQEQEQEKTTRRRTPAKMSQEGCRMVTSCRMTRTSHCALHLRTRAGHINNTNPRTTIHNPSDIAGVRSSTIYSIHSNKQQELPHIEGTISAMSSHFSYVIPSKPMFHGTSSQSQQFQSHEQPHPHSLLPCGLTKPAPSQSPRYVEH